MIQTIQLRPGVTLRCFRDHRFKTGRLSIQFLRLMSTREVALNAMLPAVLLRGCAKYPDLRAITCRLDDLYGASVGLLVRHIGDYQTTGLHCSFMEDRFAMAGDRILQPMADFLGQLLLDPRLEQGAFCKDHVLGEKRNLLSAIEARKNDKRAYAAAKLLQMMAGEDPMGIPRLGDTEQAQQVTAENLYKHYKTVLKTSPVELFFVGSADADQVAQLVTPFFEKMERSYEPIAPQSPLKASEGGYLSEVMDVVQGKLQMGFVTDRTMDSGDFVAMQVMNAVFGGGATCKLFMNLREQQSLCYDIGSSYMGGKGVVTVGAGIDCHMEQQTRDGILCQLESCCQGDITDGELQSAKQGLLSGLQGLYDSPGAIENYYSTAALSGLGLTVEQYAEAVKQVDKAQVARMAQSLRLHSTFFLKGGKG